MEKCKLIVVWVLVLSITSISSIGTIHAANGAVQEAVSRLDANEIKHRIEQSPSLSSYSYRTILIGFFKQYLRDLILRFVTMKLASLARADFNRAAKIAFFMGSTFVSSLVDYITKTSLEHLANRFMQRTS